MSTTAESMPGVLTFLFGARHVPGRRSAPARRCTRVSYPWTRVPKGLPPLDLVQVGLLPLAAFFMGVVWSRLGGLSLRSTLVTPATLWLSTAVVLLVGL